MRRKINACRIVLIAAAILLSKNLSARPVEPITPDLVGISADSARQVVASLSSVQPLSLVVLSDSVFTDSIEEGLIAWQEPLPDSLLTDTIKVRPAAPLTIKVPDVLGVPLLKAKDIVEGMHLAFFPVKEIESEEYPAGTIAKTIPDPQTPIKRGETVSVVTSVGVPEYTPTTTSTGVEIHLYETPEFNITSASLISHDSSGFILEFALKFKNPYEHSMSAEKFKYDLQVNRSTIGKGLSSDVSASAGVKTTTYLKLRIPVTYTSIPSGAAALMLAESEYRIVGTYALTVESGFSRREFDARGKFNLFTEDSEVKERLSAIAAGNK